MNNNRLSRSELFVLAYSAQLLLDQPYLESDPTGLLAQRAFELLDIVARATDSGVLADSLVTALAGLDNGQDPDTNAILELALAEIETYQ